MPCEICDAKLYALYEREQGRCASCQRGDTASRLKRERDRLAAENAELRKTCEEINKHKDLWRQHTEILKVELASANATLDALREAVPEDATGWTTDEIVAAFFKAQHKLYPQPKETTDDNLG